MLKEMDHLEAAAMNAWPAVHSVLYGGYVLRFAGGYTRRANSVNWLYPNATPPGDLIAYSEERYAQRDLPPVFRIVQRPETAALDDALAARGYQKQDESVVMACGVDELLASTAGAARNMEREVAAEPAPLEDRTWLAAYAHMNGNDPASITRHGQILASIVPPAYRAACCVDRAPIACGLAVADGPRCGFFDLVTEAKYRGRGIGSALLQSMAQWAQSQDAATCYLQVVGYNAGAQRLYRRQGFVERYRYWYRLPPG